MSSQAWAMTRSINFTMEKSPRCWITADPRELWPRETDFVRWLSGNPGLLAACLGLRGLEVTGREVVTGYQRGEADALGRSGWRGGLRMDLTARDADGRFVVAEGQFDEGDHAHLGKLVTYARAERADVAVWIIAGIGPVWGGEDLEALAELNELFAGRRQFCAVAVTLESRPGPVPDWEAPLAPRLRRVDLASRSFLN
jgi:hypothetical protein